MLINVLVAGGVLAAIGFILGALLWFASKTFHVEEDSRIDDITSCLPGANCGGCGYPGCSGYAAAIVNDGVPANLCGVADSAAVAKITDILGVEAIEHERKTAFVRCRGGNNIANKKYVYHGMNDCIAEARLLDGHMACKYGCIGFGTCTTVCPTHAISVVDGVAVVDQQKCIGCGVCANICPKHVIDIVPVSTRAFIACSSHDKGAVTKMNCASGCLGCKLCEKVCPHGAIKVDSNVASVDSSLCTACGACVEKCPIHIIKIYQGL